MADRHTQPDRLVAKRCGTIGVFMLYQSGDHRLERSDQADRVTDLSRQREPVVEEAHRLLGTAAPSTDQATICR